MFKINTWKIYLASTFNKKNKTLQLNVPKKLLIMAIYEGQIWLKSYFVDNDHWYYHQGFMGKAK